MVTRVGKIKKMRFNKSFYSLLVRAHEFFFCFLLIPPREARGKNRIILNIHF